MNRTPEEIKKLITTFITGAMGAMTFGAYHQFTTNKIMELNNQVFLDKFNMEREQMNNKFTVEREQMNNKFTMEREIMKNENKILLEKIIALENRRWFF